MNYLRFVNDLQTQTMQIQMLIKAKTKYERHFFPQK